MRLKEEKKLLWSHSCGNSHFILPIVCTRLPV